MLKNCSVLVSGCLLGLKTRYDATDNYSQTVIDFLKSNNLTPIPVCPEQLAGFTTPRPKCWFSCGNGKDAIAGQGKLISEEGKNVTEAFIMGAHETLKVARLTGCRHAILQQRSPSCGTLRIYLNQQLTEGMGVTAALLESEGLTLIGDDQLNAIM